MTKLSKTDTLDTDGMFPVSAPQGGRAQAEADRGRIADGLKAAIAAGTFGGSGRLPTERALAEQFDTNRNTIRKVLNDLAEVGLIERHVGRGTFVASGDAMGDTNGGPDFTLAELLEARLVFEPHLPDLVVERATEADFSDMDAYLNDLMAARTWSDFKEAKYSLHLMIVRAAGNRFLTAMFEQVIESRRRAQWGRPGTHPAPVAAVREKAWNANATIVQALRDRDAGAAHEHIRSYLIDTLATASQS